MGKWLGHRDICSLQWSPVCNCDPDNPIDFSDPDTCHSVDVDGEAVLVRGGEMDETDRMHFASLLNLIDVEFELGHRMAFVPHGCTVTTPTSRST